MTATRRARVRALAKINLDLRVLGRRPDGYHELRTVFQTVSLADTLEIAFTPARRTNIRTTGSIDIAGNIASRAAEAVLDTMRVRGTVEIHLRKVIPMGAGLGGGSSDAAAVLLALPVLAGRRLDFGSLARIAAGLGSDVPFFLLGGTAVGVGRGTELFPLPDGPARRGVIVYPPVHVSTAAAYQALSPRLTTESAENKIFSFQSTVLGGLQGSGFANDFEPVVFEQHPRIASVKRRLVRIGAVPALMSGSGAAVYGLFHTRDAAASAVKSFREERVFPIMLVSRSRYRSLWGGWLRAHTDTETIWPPQSRYAR